jgi:cytidylate kinase
MPGGKLIVALDGPAGAGKSTVSRRVAQALGFAYVDTGAIYRCIALKATLQGVAVGDDAALRGLVENVQVAFEFSGDVNRVKLDGRDVTDAIRTPENSRAASVVSARPVVRAGLLGLQRRLALDAPQPGAVLEGRDIGTVVFPDAELKVFLDASVTERARRRHQELLDKGGDVPSLEQVQADIVHRDAQDSQREAAPLRRATDARVLDSTAHTPQQVVEIVVGWAREKS